MLERLIGTAFCEEWIMMESRNVGFTVSPEGDSDPVKLRATVICNSLLAVCEYMNHFMIVL